ncbi:hypothetical protein [Streptomyces sp. NPDC086838]|uniref:hypothetical protein n=1 Tax=Streptomyces sp. NPDC086838 TaxID=3365762 RepID=UPI00381AE7AF
MAWDAWSAGVLRTAYAPNAPDPRCAPATRLGAFTRVTTASATTVLCLPGVGRALEQPSLPANYQYLGRDREEEWEPAGMFCRRFPVRAALDAGTGLVGKATVSHEAVCTWIHALPKGERASLGVVPPSGRTRRGPRRGPAAGNGATSPVCARSTTALPTPSAARSPVTS